MNRRQKKKLCKRMIKFLKQFKSLYFIGSLRQTGKSVAIQAMIMANFKYHYYSAMLINLSKRK